MQNIIVTAVVITPKKIDLFISKQSSIKKAAEGFMLENSAYEGFDMRIDVISIFIGADC